MKSLNLVSVILGFVFSACAPKTVSTDVGTTGGHGAKGTSNSQGSRSNGRSVTNPGITASIYGNGSRETDVDDQLSGSRTSASGARTKPTLTDGAARDVAVRGGLSKQTGGNERSSENGSASGLKNKAATSGTGASDPSVRGGAENSGRDDKGVAPQEVGAGKAPAAAGSVSRSVAGSWSGNDGAQKITVKFGANGSVILTNAAGANSGQWSALSGGRFKVQIGSHSGEMVLLNPNTASLNMGGSTIELRR